IGGAHSPAFAHAVFHLFGVLLLNGLFYLFRAWGFSFRAAIATSLAFAIAPPSIYFEHLHLYSYPTAALLCLSVALLHRAALRPSFGSWFAMFATCAALGWLRA